MPHRPAPSRIGHSDDMRDYIDRNHLTPRQFKVIYERDHFTRMTRLQRRAIGLPLPFSRSRRRAIGILLRRQDVDEVAFVRGRGKKRQVIGTYTRKRNGQIQKRDRQGRFEHMTEQESRQIHRGVKHRRPAQAKKGPVE